MIEPQLANQAWKSFGQDCRVFPLGLREQLLQLANKNDLAKTFDDPDYPATSRADLNQGNHENTLNTRTEHLYTFRSMCAMQRTAD